MVKISMNEESPLTREEHHITSLNLTQGFRFDREGVTGEQGWQHAVTKCGKAQHSRASQNLDRKIMPGLFPGWMRLRHGLADYELLRRVPRQVCMVEEILPHASAIVSNTFSSRN
jgi:hypothetical protein